VSATLVMAPAAGWYPDPNDSGSWRWWDGGTWTTHVRPKEETAPIAIAHPDPQPVSAPVAVQPVSAPVTAQPFSAPVAIQPVAVQPESLATAAQPAPQPVIPQPAQPIQPIQPVSLTPETPASEQEYWHSPNAEIIQIPGRSATSQHARPSTRIAAPRNMHTWGDVGSPQTAGIWLLAFLPIIASVLSSVVGIVLQMTIAPNGVFLDPASASQTAWAVLGGYLAILTISAWIFAGRDIATLRARRYDAPSIAWMLVPLSPLAYFIARGKVVRAEGKRAWPPELLFFLSIIVPIVLTIVVWVFAASILAGLAGAAGIPV
jgi:hypothetical protein